MRDSLRLLAIPMAFAVGIFACRWLAPLAAFTSWLLGALLLLTFLRLRLEHLRWQVRHGVILAVQLALSLAVYFVLLPLDRTLAMAGFMICITPTAVSAPAMVGMLKGDVAFVTVASVLDNIAIAAILPPLLAIIWTPEHPWDLQAFGIMVIRVLGIVALPLMASLAMRQIMPRATTWLAQRASLGFYLWAVILTIVCARSTAYLLDNPQPASRLLAMAMLALVLCALHFWIGKVIGGRKYALEAGQAMGQRNTLFTIWVSLSVLASPLVALGPTFYIVWHNAYNALQLWQRHRTPGNATMRQTDMP